jgi:phosphoribosylaminoimidazole carboxylase
LQEAALNAGDQFGYPYMLKTKRLAYDGRGNAVVSSADDLVQAVSALGGYKQGLYAEKWAPFVKELAVMVARCAARFPDIFSPLQKPPYPSHWPCVS